MRNKMETFQLYRNTVKWKKVKAKSFEEAIGLARDQIQWFKTDYFEIKTKDGRLLPVSHL
jgi:hypothetical protein